MHDGDRRDKILVPYLMPSARPSETQKWATSKKCRVTAKTKRSLLDNNMCQGYISCHTSTVYLHRQEASQLSQVSRHERWARQGQREQWPQGEWRAQTVRGAYTPQQICIYNIEARQELKLKSGRSWIIYRFCRQLCYRGDGWIISLEAGEFIKEVVFRSLCLTWRLCFNVHPHGDEKSRRRIRLNSGESGNTCTWWADE